MIPRDEARFTANAEAVAGFLAAHGRLPNSASTDAEEARLGRFLSRCRSRRAGVPNTFVWDAARERLLDELAPGWHELPPRRKPDSAALSTKLRDDRLFEHRCRRYAEFLAAHGRPPSSTSPDARERALHRWIARNRQALRGQAVTPLFPERRELLDRLIPGWDGSQHETTFRQRTEQLAAWRTRFGRWPATSAEEETERTVAAWLGRQRHLDAQGRLSEDRVNTLDELLPGWRHTGARLWPEQFDARLAEYAAFVAEHGRHPRTEAPMPERSLYQWMARLRRHANGIGGQLDPQRRRQLDEALPGWLAERRVAPVKPRRRPPRPVRKVPQGPPLDVRTTRKIATRAAEYREFVQQQRRYPVAPCPPGPQRTIAAWLAGLRRRQSAGDMGGRELDLLDELAPGWNCRDVAFRHRAELLADFIHAYGRPPDQRVTAESDLGAFAAECRLAEDGRSTRPWSADRAGLLDLLAPGWRTRVRS